jgi:hypothetical protein
VGMDSRRRTVPRGLAEFVRLRDGGRCRVPWCDAPARHIDHVVGVAEGGATVGWNLQAPCELHNYAKQAPGWRSEPVGQARDPDTTPSSPPGRSSEGEVGAERHVVATRTPTGHLYLSSSPRLPGSTTHQHDGGEHDGGEQGSREHDGGEQGSREHDGGEQVSREHDGGEQVSREHDGGEQGSREHDPTVPPGNDPTIPPGNDPTIPPGGAPGRSSPRVGYSEGEEVFLRWLRAVA